MSPTQRSRPLIRIIPAQQVSDGAGVKILRSLGLTQQLRLDPFLMLDCFGSDQPADYLAGFPPHPHRGFETVTYMLDGHMQHQDHLGNIRAAKIRRRTVDDGRARYYSFGDATAARWIDARFSVVAEFTRPAEKMKAPAYVDLTPEQLRHLTLPGGGKAVLIAGELTLSNGEQYAGPIQTQSTAPLYLDLQLKAAEQLSIQLPVGHQALLYPFEGELQYQGHQLKSHQAGILGAGEVLHLQADQPVRSSCC